KKINFKTLNGVNFAINFLKTDNIHKVSASVCSYLNSKSGIKLIYAGSILEEDKQLGDLPINFYSSRLLVIFRKMLKPQIDEEINDLVAQKDTILENETETVASPSYLSEKNKIPIQNTILDPEDRMFKRKYNSSDRFTTCKKTAPGWCHPYQLSLLSYEKLVKYNDHEDFETNRNRELLYDLQQVSTAYKHNPYYMNDVFEDFAHLCPDIIKKLKSNPKQILDVESLLASRREVHASNKSNDHKKSACPIDISSLAIMTYEESMSFQR
ncbi:hypothetical protein HZS_800, partial [Henneguya salminicola]